MFFNLLLYSSFAFSITASVNILYNLCHHDALRKSIFSNYNFNFKKTFFRFVLLSLILKISNITDSLKDIDDFNELTILGVIVFIVIVSKFKDYKNIFYNNNFLAFALSTQFLCSFPILQDQSQGINHYLLYAFTLWYLLTLSLENFIFLRNRQGLKSHQSDSEEANKSSDNYNAICKLSDDKIFGEACIKQFSKEILDYDYVNSKEAFTHSIIAKWGAGKTSFLSLVKNELENKLNEEIKYSGLKLIDFKPWHCKNENEIINEFANTLTDHIDENHRLKKKIDDYADKLINQFSDKFLGLKFFESNSSLNNTLEELATLLQNSDSIKGFIVFIDDLDRLKADEIYAVLRLVRDTFELPKLYFIVAFDKEYVVETLEKIIPSKTKTYIEKIFNKEFDLPKVSYQVLESELIDEILEFCEGGKDFQDEYKWFSDRYKEFLGLWRGSNLPTHVVDDRYIQGTYSTRKEWKYKWIDNFRKILKPNLVTFRDLHRILAVFKDKFSMMKGKCVFKDLLILVITQIYYHDFYLNLKHKEFDALGITLNSVSKGNEYESCSEYSLKDEKEIEGVSEDRKRFLACLFRLDEFEKISLDAEIIPIDRPRDQKLDYSLKKLDIYDLYFLDKHCESIDLGKLLASFTENELQIADDIKFEQIPSLLLRWEDLHKLMRERLGRNSEQQIWILKLSFLFKILTNLYKTSVYHFFSTYRLLIESLIITELRRYDSRVLNYPEVDYKEMVDNIYDIAGEFPLTSIFLEKYGTEEFVSQNRLENNFTNFLNDINKKSEYWFSYCSFDEYLYRFYLRFPSFHCRFKDIFLQKFSEDFEFLRLFVFYQLRVIGYEEFYFASDSPLDVHNEQGIELPFVPSTLVTFPKVFKTANYARELVQVLQVHMENHHSYTAELTDFIKALENNNYQLVKYEFKFIKPNPYIDFIGG
ncbi:MAG: hypothetical protein HRT47_12610 [Candidatus Caenarcaniphilales bacterium]|nr:hypothetical protein [Candidatus Caenarcaniphilales bacterium]